MLRESQRALADELGEQQEQIEDRKAEHPHGDAIGLLAVANEIDADRMQDEQRAERDGENAIDRRGEADQPGREAERRENERVKQNLAARAIRRP